MCWVLISLLYYQVAAAERIKDIASWSGVRSNQLIGYGLVVGLDGTGDRTTQTQFTVQTFKTMLANLGIQLPPGDIPKLKNVAAVILNAQLPAFSRPGQTIDVTVSSVANAKSLRGGTLLMAPLKGIDGVVYAVAQGNLVVGGFGAQGSDGSKITVNVPSAGNIPNGATVERAAPSNFGEGKSLTLLLNQYDFTTAQRVTYQINELLGSPVAAALDGGAIGITAPLDKSQRVAFMSLLENTIVQPGIAAARVIVNSRTGTVVISQGVKVLPAAISHGNLTVTISEQPQVSQPAPFSGGQTAIVSNSSVEIEQQNSRMFLFNPGAQLKDIVAAVNDVGAAPGDLMAILEALKRAGALNAEILVI